MILTIRTANRAPKRNYLGQTLRTLLAQGFDPQAVHLFPTDPDVAWMRRELSGLPALTVHVPVERCGPNANGIRQVSVLSTVQADWIWLFEDDLDCCEAASLTSWLADHAAPEIHVYRFHALPGTRLRRIGPYAAVAPLREMRGSQAVAMRAEDAQMFAEWALAHPRRWRPREAPFQDRPDRGFDKLIGYGALALWPDQPDGLVALPMLVNHVGRESTLHGYGVRNDPQFAGPDWRYPQVTHGPAA